MGWLGWTEAQALSADVNAIAIAYEGRLDMLATIGLVKRETPPATPQRRMTEELFDTIFR